MQILLALFKIVRQPIIMNLVMRRNPTTFDLRHVTSRDSLLTIDGTFPSDLRTGFA